MFLVDFGFFLEPFSIIVFSTFVFLFLHRSSTADTPCIFQRCLNHYTFHLLNLFEKGVNIGNRDVSWLYKQLMLGFLEILMFLKNDKKKKHKIHTFSFVWTSLVHLYKRWFKWKSSISVFKKIVYFILETNIRNRKKKKPLHCTKYFPGAKEFLMGGGRL